MKIVADNTVPFLKGIAEPIAEVKYLTSKEFTPENVQDADILIVRSIDKCTRELLEGSRVKLITSATIGFDHIDTRYCDKAGITWKNSPGCNAVSVAQYVLSGLVTIALRKGEPLQGTTLLGHVFCHFHPFAIFLFVAFGHSPLPDHSFSKTLVIVIRAMVKHFSHTIVSAFSKA